KAVLFPPDGGDLTDGELLAAYLAQRNEAAFAALVRRHGSMVLGVCRRLLRSVDDAEDAFQATFLVLARKAGSVRPPGAVGNWLLGVGRRTALQARRAVARRVARERQVTVMPELSIEPVKISNAELQTVLDQELSQLPDKLRLPIVLCHLEGRTRRQVARQLKLPEGTLSNRISAARELLASRLTRRGYALPVTGLAAALASTAKAVVPAALVGSTVRAALVLSAGQRAAAGLISAGAAHLLKKELQVMFWTKLMKVTTVLLVIGVSGGGVTALLRPVTAARLVGTTTADEAKPERPAAPPGAAAVEAEATRIQGTWHVVAMEERGVTQPESRYKDVNMRIVVTNRTLAIKTTAPDGRDVGPEMAYVLNEKVSPNAIDASKDGRTIVRIYLPEKDTRKLCFRLDGTTRPTGFETKRRSNQRSYVLKKRATPAK